MSIIEACKIAGLSVRTQIGAPKSLEEERAAVAAFVEGLRKHESVFHSRVKAKTKIKKLIAAVRSQMAEELKLHWEKVFKERRVYEISARWRCPSILHCKISLEQGPEGEKVKGLDLIGFRLATTWYHSIVSTGHIGTYQTYWLN